jgi:nitrile hydratase subunit beta
MADPTMADLGRFREGDRVRVLTDVPEGNPRTPRYLRGRTGTVVRRHGVVVNPLDHHDPYPPLYSVVFVLTDDRGAPDEVLADLHEEWLTPG